MARSTRTQRSSRRKIFRRLPSFVRVLGEARATTRSSAGGTRGTCAASGAAHVRGSPRRARPRRRRRTPACRPASRRAPRRTRTDRRGALRDAGLRRALQHHLRHSPRRSSTREPAHFARKCLGYLPHSTGSSPHGSPRPGERITAAKRLLRELHWVLVDRAIPTVPATRARHAWRAAGVAATALAIGLLVFAAMSYSQSAAA